MILHFSEVKFDRLLTVTGCILLDDLCINTTPDDFLVGFANLYDDFLEVCQNFTMASDF